MTWINPSFTLDEQGNLVPLEGEALRQSLETYEKLMSGINQAPPAGVGAAMGASMGEGVFPGSPVAPVSPRPQPREKGAPLDWENELRRRMRDRLERSRPSWTGRMR